LKIISIDVATLIKQGKSVFNRLAKMDKVELRETLQNSKVETI